MLPALLIPVLSKLLDKVIPDPAAREAAKLELIKAETEIHLKEVEIQLSAIIAEANSTDPWTSRARPSFLYVFYAVILAGIPMGVLFALSPEIAANITNGWRDWLVAIPEQMWALFGVGYLGYTGARSLDKRKGV